MSGEMLADRPVGTIRRRTTRLVVLAISALVMSGCASATGTSGDSPMPAPSATDAAEEASATPDATMPELVGYWHRAQSCEELLTAFEAAGLAESHRGWLQGNFYGGAEGPASGDPCAGAAGPLEHSHWFTATGQFGSHDQAGQQVDGGDYSFVDADTLSFPSHASEFGYGGDVLVDFSIDDEVVTFGVALPDPCDEACRNAYAWALSAFSSGPWSAGDVP